MRRMEAERSQEESKKRDKDVVVVVDGAEDRNEICYY